MYIWWCRYFNKHTSYCTIVKSIYNHWKQSVCGGLGMGGGGVSIVVYTVIIISLCPSHIWVGPPTSWHIKVAYNMRMSYDPDHNLFWPRWRSHHHQQQNGPIKVFLEQLLVLFSFKYGEVKLLFSRFFSLCLI